MNKLPVQRYAGTHTLSTNESGSIIVAVGPSVPLTLPPLQDGLWFVVVNGQDDVTPDVWCRIVPGDNDLLLAPLLSSIPDGSVPGIKATTRGTVVTIYGVAGIGWFAHGALSTDWASL
jgi:hypothetical protein